MVDLKCVTCKNYHSKEGTCILDDVPIGHAMTVDSINQTWGITFTDCRRFESIL
jgi:hypothetical protein